MRKADNLPQPCAVVTKSGNLNFLEPSRSVLACNGTALPCCINLASHIISLVPDVLENFHIFTLLPAREHFIWFSVSFLFRIFWHKEVVCIAIVSLSFSTLECCLNVHLSHEAKWNANLMQRGNFIYVFLARHVSGTYAHHQEHWMLSCSLWVSAPSFWMGGGLESRWVKSCLRCRWCRATGRTAPSAP